MLLKVLAQCQATLIYLGSLLNTYYIYAYILLITDVQQQAEIENKFLSIIDEVSSRKRDVVDSFLDQLGDILRRLSYVRRRNLQRRLIDIAIEEEDAELEERASAK